MAFFTQATGKIPFQVRLQSLLKLFSTILWIITTFLSQLEAQIFFGLKFFKTQPQKNIKIQP
jgi:hypothetical protein